MDSAEFEKLRRTIEFLTLIFAFIITNDSTDLLKVLVEIFYITEIGYQIILFSVSYLRGKHHFKRSDLVINELLFVSSCFL